MIPYVHVDINFLKLEAPILSNILLLGCRCLLHVFQPKGKFNKDICIQAQSGLVHSANKETRTLCMFDSLEN